MGQTDTLQTLVLLSSIPPTWVRLMSVRLRLRVKVRLGLRPFTEGEGEG